MSPFPVCIPTPCVPIPLICPYYICPHPPYLSLLHESPFPTYIPTPPHFPFMSPLPVCVPTPIRMSLFPIYVPIPYVPTPRMCPVCLHSPCMSLLRMSPFPACVPTLYCPHSYFCVSICVSLNMFVCFSSPPHLSTPVCVSLYIFVFMCHPSLCPSPGQPTNHLRNLGSPLFQYNSFRNAIKKYSSSAHVFRHRRQLSHSR